MKILVHPDFAGSVPSSLAKDSMVRQEVVPTQIIRPPLALVWFTMIRRLLGDGAELRVHIVGFHVVHLHRPEGAQPHMEGHIGQLDAHGLHLFQQLRREVQPCRGRSGGADHLGVDRLVALLVLQFLFDVGRQGHPPQLLQHLQEDAFIEKLHQPVPVRQHFLNLRLQLPVSKVDMGTGAELLARPHQAFPHVVPPVGEQQHLRALRRCPGGR